MRESRGKLSRHAPVAKAMDYMLVRWEAFARFLGDGRICLTNNAAERALRGIALGRKAWLFAGSDRGGDRAAAMLSLIRSVASRRLAMSQHGCGRLGPQTMQQNPANRRRLLYHRRATTALGILEAA